MSDQRIGYLFRKCLDQAATIAEKEELYALLEKPGNEVLLKTYISEFVDTPGSLSDMDAGKMDAILKRIFEVDGTSVTASEATSRTLSTVPSKALSEMYSEVSFTTPSEVSSAPIHSVPYRKRKIWQYAAAVLLLLGSGLYIWLSVPQKSSEAQPPVAGSSALGKATLTLADGTIIVLDSAAEGNLAIQGNTKVIKLNAGQISYATGLLGGKSASSGGSAALYNTVTTPVGGMYQVILPDGSNVWLNAASSLRFPTRFTGGSRAVEIEGEAYFEISPNAGMPFFVTARDIKIEVLGTGFNVNAYREEPEITTTLVNGSVQVKYGSYTALLKPGEQVLNGSGTDLNYTRRADIPRVLAWKNGYFEFDRADIRSIMRQLARWYNLEIDYKDEIKERLIATIPRNAPVSQVLRVLESTRAVRFKIEGNKITVMRNDDE